MKHQFSCQCHQFGDTSGELKEVPDEEAVVVEEVLVATDEEDRVIVESDRDEEDTEERDGPSQAPLQGENEHAGQEADVEGCQTGSGT